MKVIIYIAVFAAIVAVLAIGGALCESEALEERSRRAAGAFARAIETIVGVALLPVEAAYYFIDRAKTH